MGSELDNIITEGRQLLGTVSLRYKNTNLSAEQMREILAETLKDSAFSNSTIKNVAGSDYVNPYEKMYVSVGEYQVWFVKEGDDWVLKYKKAAII